MQLSASKIGVAAASLLLAACVPFPNRHYFAPAISGIVTNAGAPVAGAELHLSSRFTKKVATASTDGAGHFEIGPLRTWEATIGIGDPAFTYSVSIRALGSDYPGLAVDLNLGYAPTKLEITCDLAKPAIVGQSTQYCILADNTEHP